MRIVLDFNPVLRNRYSGFWTYGTGLLAGLVEMEEVASIALLCSRGELAAAGEVAFWRHPKCCPVPTSIRLRRLERWWGLVPRPRLQRFCGALDVYHSFHHLMPPTGAAPRVLTVHDLRRYRLGDLYGHSKVTLFERSVRAADRVLAVSESTRRDLVELLGMDADRIDVAWEGTPPGFEPASPGQRAETLRWLSEKLGVSLGGFAITLGSRDRRKNLPAVVRAFARAASKLPGDFRLLIVGHVPGDDADLNRALAEPGLADRVVRTGPLSDAEYRRVLPAARMLLFLSRYEGFGLPLLEAMAAGVPVVASANSSIPEVVGDAGRLVDAEDVDGIARHVAELAGDDVACSALVDAGLRRCRQFTWRRTAEQTVQCYRRAIQRKTG